MTVLLDLGCGRRKHAGAIGVDRVSLETVDVVSDLLAVPYPFASACAEHVILSHVLEHFSVNEIDSILSEVHRVLAPGGMVTVSVPHALSVAAWVDPTHRTGFTFETLFYFTREHAFSYYREIHPMWRVRRVWASVNLLNNHLAAASAQQRWLEAFASRVMSYIVCHSRTMTVPDLLVKVLPFWLVSVHCCLEKATALDRGLP